MSRYFVPMTRTEILDLAAVAEVAGIGADSARTYHTRAVAHRRAGKPRPGDLPPPDTTVGRSPAWYRETIQRWLETRPGRGVGGGRPRQPVTDSNSRSSLGG